MELTKEQIQYIDYRLENEGIKYWDVRIELLDHIVSDIEKNLNENSSERDFKNKVQNVFVSLGWKENFNGGGFDAINKQGWKNVNKFYRKMYFKGFLDFFKKPKNLIILVLFLLGYYAISEILEAKTFLKISYILFFLPFFYLCLFFTQFTRKSMENQFTKIIVYII